MSKAAGLVRGHCEGGSGLQTFVSIFASARGHAGSLGNARLKYRP
jgi:hypothetical protein